ncbi:MAG: hypothetical protein NTV81_02985 [Candidatus Komeilibacteria bacterium]|nr:hypothetical protein [Candidatus Komeilibacteria bacterium]
MANQDLTDQDLKLINLAKATAKKYITERWEGDRISSVAACVRMKSGQVYCGPNIKHPHSSPSSLDAENTALAVAYANGEREAEVIIAYHYADEDHQGVVSPCGQCREFLRLFGDPQVIVEGEKGLEKRSLLELLPNSENF